MAKIKKMNKMLKIRGTISNVFNAKELYEIALMANSHSDAIDYLYSVVCQQNKEIEELQKQFEKFKEILNREERENE